MGRVRVHVLVTGRVQGVSYRAWTQATARRAGVVGWVRNLQDGRVEAMFEGSEEAVAQVVAWCHQGSPAARVVHVATRTCAVEGADPGFAVRPTAPGPAQET